MGLITGGVTKAGNAMARDIGTGRPPKDRVSMGVTALAPPAGGTGAQAGCYDSASNRDLMIVALTATRTDIAALRAELVAVGIVKA